jgi:hypothetical protein
VKYPERFAFGFVEPGPGIEGSMSVALLDDAVPEPDETLSVNILEVSEARLSGPSTVVGAITDDE